VSWQESCSCMRQVAPAFLPCRCPSCTILHNSTKPHPQLTTPIQPTPAIAVQLLDEARDKILMGTPRVITQVRLRCMLAVAEAGTDH